MRSVLAFLTILLAGRIVHSSADVSVLFPSGRAGTDGIGIQSFQRPVVEPSGRVAFVGQSTALARIENGTASALARTGDPLPAPLTGTFNRIGSLALSRSGIVVFGATLNSTAAGDGIFRRDAGGLVPIVLDEGSGFDLAVDDDGAIAYRMGRRIRLVPAGGAPAVVVDGDSVIPDGGQFQRFGDIALGAGPTVVFEARLRGRGVDGLFRWTPSVGVERLVAQPNFDTRSRFALGSSGLVAFVERTGTVSLIDPAGGTTTVIAQTGLPVGNDVLEEVEVGYLHVDDLGSVFLVGRLGTARRLIRVTNGVATAVGGDLGDARLGRGRSDDGTLVATSGGRLVFVSADGASTPAPSTDAIDASLAVLNMSIDRDGGALAYSSRDALYRLDGDAATPITRVGADVPGVGRIAYIYDLALDARSFVVLVELADGARVLLADQGGSLRKVVAQGDPVPGGTLLLNGGSLIVRRGWITFDSGVDGGPGAIFTVRTRGGRVRRHVHTGGPAGRGRTLGTLDLVQWLGSGIVFSSSTEETFDLLVRRPGRRITSIARTDGNAPGGGHFYQLGGVLIGDRRLVFDASLRETTDVFQTFVKDGKRVRVLAPPAGLTGSPAALLGDRLLYSVDGLATLIAAGRTDTEMIVAVGGPSPAGGTIALINELSAAGRRAVIAADLDQASVASALLQVVERR